MNIRDYYIIEHVLLIISILGYVIGVYLLQIFKTESTFNMVFLIFISIFLLINALFFHLKRVRFEDEMLEEIKNCLKDFKKYE